MTQPKMGEEYQNGSWIN